MRDYQVVSPSLTGIICHESLAYEGIRRPSVLLRVLDAPKLSDYKVGGIASDELTPDESKVLEEYFQDLHGIFMKKFAFFVVEEMMPRDETVKLQAMLEEMIKVKRLMGRAKAEN